MPKLRIDVWTPATALVACLLVTACSGGSGGSQDASQSEEWLWLETTERQLEEQRQRLAELGDQIAGYDPEAADGESPEGAEPPEGAEEPPSLEELEAEAERLGGEVQELAAEFDGRLTEFINAQGIDPELELTEVQKSALRMKSDEAILAAREFIDKGGDYQRAIDIYRQAQTIDPGYERLQQLIDEAEVLRWMTEERFAQAKKGMTPDEVRAVLGPVYLRDVQEYPERNALAWFYRKQGPGKPAAGVFFQKEQGEYRVYEADFNAIGDDGP